MIQIPSEGESALANGLPPGPLGVHHMLGADHNLLLGLLAFQNGFIDHHTLVDAVHAWMADKSRPLGMTLRGWRALDESRLEILTLLVDQHLKSKGGASKGLGKIESTISLIEGLGPIEDDEVRNWLAEAEAHRSLRGEGPSGCRYRKPGQDPDFSGGLGDLYIAEDLELGRQVALKEICPKHASNPQARARFLLEGEVTGKLEHPGIVPVYGLGRYPDGRPYYAMRLIKGKNLKETIDEFRRGHPGCEATEEKALGLRKLLRRFIDACNAIEYAHSREVLHRDIKPANIMLGKYGETIVVDWGLAKILGAAEDGVEYSRIDPEEGPLLASSSSLVEPTRMDMAHGTLQYMSPEQAGGRIDEIGPACDIYGLGSTLYYILTGRAPFPGGVRSEIIAGKFPRPREIDPGVPGALEAVCLKAMEARPVDRYPSAIALAEDVERWLGDQPVSAYHDPLSARAARWVRLHRPFVAGAAALLVTASIGLMVSNVLVRLEADKAEAARGLAETARGQAEADLRLAIGAIENMLVQVSESTLIFQPGMIEHRAKLMEEANRLYDDLISRHPDDLETRLKAAMALRTQANNLRLIGQYARSLEFSGRSIAGYRAITALHPDDPTYIDLLGHARVDHGDGLWTIGRAGEAVESYRRATLEVEASRESHPENLGLLLSLGRARLGLGDALLEAGDLAGSSESYEESIRLFTRIQDVKEMGILGRLLRAPGLCGRGLVAGQEGRGKEAERAFADALKDLEEIDPGAAKNPDAQYYRAVVLDALGEHLARDPARRQAAKDAFDEAAALSRKLADRFKSTVEYKLEHATAGLDRAAVTVEFGQVAGPEVEADIDAALTTLRALLVEIPGLPKARAKLGRLMMLRGRLALDRRDPVEARNCFSEASREWKEALEAQPSNPTYRAQLDRSLEAIKATNPAGPR